MNVARPIVLLALVAAGLGGVAGCGSTTVRHVTTTITRSTSTSGPSSTSSSSSTPTSTTTTSTGAASATAHRSPAALLRASAAALRGSGGYAMHADLRQDGTRVQISLTANPGNVFDATITTKGQVSEIINVAGGGYLRGNRAFWSSEGGSSPAARARAAQLANHWLHVPASTRRSLIHSLGSLQPRTLAGCLTEDHGHLSLAGYTRVGGRRALVVHDDGDAPGATPGTIAVAASGEPYPLRYTATGRSRRGGHVDVCNDGKGADAEGSIVLSQFGSVAPPQAPGRSQAGGANA